MNELPKVSIIMPNYNCGDYIENSIKSVINQTYSNWELIIVDDNSTDNSVEIINKYVKLDSRIKLYKHDVNKGAAVSRNLAISKSKGEFIAFLDSDDLWLENKLALQVDFMIKNNLDFCYSYYYLNDVNSKVIKAPKYMNYKKMLRWDSIGCLTVMYRVKNVGKMQIIDLPKRNDYALWLKILKKVDGKLLPLPLAIYTVRKNSISRNKFKLIKHQYNVFRKSEEYSIFLSLFFTARNLFFILINKILRKIF